MAETILLEVPATSAALSTVRIVLGGLGARLDLSLEELEDLYLATEELLRAALAAEPLERLSVEVVFEDRQLRIIAGRFSSAELRKDLDAEKAQELCLGLCRLLRMTVDGVELLEAGGAYSVALVKRRREGAA